VSTRCRLNLIYR